MSIEVFYSPFFSISLCIFAYALGSWVQRKTKSILCNPLLLSIVFVIVILKTLGIPYEEFMSGGRMISLFLAPATASLALTIYRRFDVLKANVLPVMGGVLVGSLVSMGSIFGLCKLFGLNQEMTASLLPKSVTTPIAMEVSEQLHGVVPITVAAVVFTGILGAIFAPYMIRLFKIKSPIATGVGIGTCSHAVGTSKAIQLGEVEGCMSSIAMATAGVITVFIGLLLS